MKIRSKGIVEFYLVLKIIINMCNISDAMSQQLKT